MHKKRPGDDNIILEMVKCTGENIFNQLEKLYDKCLQECEIPNDYLNASVVHMFKMQNKHKLSN